MRFAALFALAAFSTAVQQTDYQISGVVVDHLTKRPLNHVLVEITQTGKGGGTASVVTEEDGRFTFLHVPKGKYTLDAQRRGQFPQGFHASDGGFATAIVVDGSLKTTDLIFPLRSDSSISGLVLGDDGEPIRAQVSLFREGVINGDAQVIHDNATGTSAAGHFHFGHLEPGKYYLAANGLPWYAQPGNAAGLETVYPVTFYAGTPYGTTDANAATPITLTEGATANVQITMQAVPGIHVKVPNGQNVLVWVAGPGGSEVPARAMVTNLVRAHPQEGAPENTFELQGLAAGRYRISVVGHDGELRQTSETVDLVNGSTLTLDNDHASAQVSGRIIFDGPRPGGDLELFLVSPSGGVRINVATRASVAADGTFKFDKVSGGKFEVHIGSPQLVISSMEAKGARVAHDRLEITSGTSVELVLHATAVETLAKVDGFALQGESGFAGAMILLLPQDLARTRLFQRDQSDADGSFTFASVQPGRYTLVAIDDGHDLAYKDPKLITPYLEHGLSITVPLKSNEPLKVTVQNRR